MTDREPIAARRRAHGDARWRSPSAAAAAPARTRWSARSIVDDDGVVVGTGFHERAGEAARRGARAARAGRRARGATLYCTLEPCSHTGRTGPCAVAVAEAGIRRVVAAMQDPYPEVAGRGFAYLREHGVDVEVGVARGRGAAAQRGVRDQRARAAAVRHR